MKLNNFNTKALIANFVVWALFVTISLSASFIDANRAGIEVDVPIRIIGYLISFIPWMLITPVFYWFLQKQQEQKKLSILATSLILLVSWAPVVVILETASYSIMRKTELFPLIDSIIALPIVIWVYCFLLYAVILGACLALLYYRRSNANRLEALKAKQTNVELELQLSELRIQSLLSQLEPHFLFNALNSIASLVRTLDKKRALTAIRRLSDLLRYAIEASNQKYVNFEDELNFVQDYLSLQSLRFEEKLSIKLLDKRSVQNQICPPFLLQTFVENAIKHGLEAEGSAMNLLIEITDNQSLHEQTNHYKDTLHLLVKNSHLQTIKKSKGLGIGLTNLKARLDILYQENVTLETSNTSDFYQVKLQIPAHG
ncbi:sensor histidine kinase [Aliikangiella sp. IMCC44359]|uniref:sensor histidine kinase n=1 Tax=Aliikangiella sp. IMCC44359 TaxID=3459125 RepID=UPI00403AFC50